MSYWDFLVKYVPDLLSGAMTTALQMVCAAALAIVVSLIFGLMRLAPVAPVRWMATIYIEFFRGTSLLVQLYWIYYVLPLMGLSVALVWVYERAGTILAPILLHASFNAVNFALIRFVDFAKHAGN